jgi:DNA-binding NarL/FixJ family response regulator
MNSRIERIVDVGGASFTFLMVGLVSAASITLSFGALLDLARASEVVPYGLVWMWPAMFDIFVLAATCAVLWSALQGERDRYAWSMIISFTVLSVIFNAAHAGLDGILSLHPSALLILKIVIGVIPPISAALSVHLLERLLEQIFGRVTVMQSVVELHNERGRLSAEISTMKEEQESLASRLAEMREEVAGGDGDLEQDERLAVIVEMHEDGMTKREMADRLGVSESTIYRDFKKLNGRLKC